MSSELSIEQRIHDLAIAYVTILFSKSPCDPQTLLENYSDFVRRAPEFIDID